MADIYTSKAISPQYRSSFRASQAQYDDKSKELKQMAMKEKQEADEIYSLSVNNAAKMNMNELFTQYSADPKALSEELKKLGSKISDEMPNDEMKVSFLSNYNLSSQSLVNRAQANFDKQQEINRKQAIKDSITNNINSMKLALSNGLSGSGSIDDLVNFQEAYKKNRNLVGSKNKKAQSTFTDAEKLAFDNDTNKVMVETFKETLNSMTDADKQDLIERLNNDDVVLLNVEAPEQKTSILADSINKYKSEDLEKQIKDIVSKIDIKSVVADAAQSVVNENLEDTDAIQQAIAGKIQEPIKDVLTKVEETKKEVKQPKSVQKKINLKDVVDETTYNDIKKAAKETDIKLKKKAVQEWNTNKAYSQIQLYQEPNEQNYKTWEFYHQDASDDKKQEMRELANYVPNEDANTTYEGYSDAYLAIKNLAEKPSDNQKQIDELYQDSINVLLNIHRSNQNDTLSSKEVDDLKETLNNVLTDNIFKRQIEKLPSTALFSSLMGSDITHRMAQKDELFTSWGSGLAEGWEWIKHRNKIGEISQKTMQDLINLYSNTLSEQDVARINEDIGEDITTYPKSEAAEKIYENGIINAMRERYYWEPSLKQKMVKGKTIINLGGQSYYYMGIGNDILLEKK